MPPFILKYLIIPEIHPRRIFTEGPKTYARFVYIWQEDRQMGWEKNLKAYESIIIT